MGLLTSPWLRADRFDPVRQPIAILSALRAEIEALLDMADESHIRHLETMDLWECRIADTETALAVGGIGKVGAAVSTTLLHEHIHPRMVIFTGVAGGLDPNLGVGDLVIGERTIQHDAGYYEDGHLVRYQPGHVPFFNPTDEFGFAPSRDTLTSVIDSLEDFEPRQVQARQPRVATGTILTGDQFVNDDATREHLWDGLGGLAVDMEGAAMAQAAEALGMDHLVIRALSDVAGADSIEDFSQFLDEVVVNLAVLTRHLLPRL